MKTIGNTQTYLSCSLSTFNRACELCKSEFHHREYSVYQLFQPAQKKGLHQIILTTAHKSANPWQVYRAALACRVMQPVHLYTSCLKVNGGGLILRTQLQLSSWTGYQIWAKEAVNHEEKHDPWRPQWLTISSTVPELLHTFAPIVTSGSRWGERRGWKGVWRRSLRQCNTKNTLLLSSTILTHENYSNYRNSTLHIASKSSIF